MLVVITGLHSHLLPLLPLTGRLTHPLDNNNMQLHLDNPLTVVIIYARTYIHAIVFTLLVTLLGLLSVYVREQGMEITVWYSVCFA